LAIKTSGCHYAFLAHGFFGKRRSHFERLPKTLAVLTNEQVKVAQEKVAQEENNDGYLQCLLRRYP